mmetsp:Transcript_23700/g.30924  ORF Transcript_23700/g.30924 Transcript_23700/m.30924 type:complete len:363 (+) Transcript_23700:59-1147(+)
MRGVSVAALLAALVCSYFNNGVDAFATGSLWNTRMPDSARIGSSGLLHMSAVDDTTPATAAANGDQLTNSGLLKRDRYVATNRFAVRNGKEAKFEKRWATRKSRLASLQGFKYFHLMRRVTLNEDDDSTTYQGGDKQDKSNEGNYVSFTIWDKKSDFSAWRTGEAFKEAHGGTSIGAFVSTMVNSALVLQGAPRPAFYDGLLLQSTKPESVPDLVDGWRSVDADGVTTLPAECFVACNQFFVPRQNAPAFEKRWADRESQLKECDGFVAFSMLRRDGQAKGHGTKPMGDDEPTYLSTTVWKDRASFDGWRSGTAFKKAHGSSEKKKKTSDGADAKPPPPLWSRPPVPVFYEGTLVITTEDGA